MTSEQYDKTRTAILLAGSLVDQLSVEELSAIIQVLEKGEDIGVVDRALYEEVRGNTKLILLLAKNFLVIKSALVRE